MKNIFKFSLLGLVLAFLFASCEKEKIVGDYPEEMPTNESNAYSVDLDNLDESLKTRAGSIDYPLSTNYPLHGPTIVFPGDTIRIRTTYYLINPRPSFYWYYSHTYFKLIGYEKDELGISGTTIVLKVDGLNYWDGDYRDFYLYVNMKDNISTDLSGETVIRIYKNKPTIAGPDVLCDDNTATYSLTNLPSETTSIDWYSNFGGAVSGKNTKTATFEILNNDHDLSVGAYVKVTGADNNGLVRVNKPVHKGKPIFLSGNEYDNKFITRRDVEVFIGNPKVKGSDRRISWRLSGYASMRHEHDYSGVYIKSYLPENESNTIKLFADISNDCGTSTRVYEIEVQKTSDIPLNRWNISTPVISKGWVKFEMVFKATKDYTLYSMYSTLLYKGAYDGYYSNEDWDWKYDEWYDSYYIPQVSNMYGDQNCIYDSESYPIKIKAGETYYMYVNHRIYDDMGFGDLEYLIFHCYDALDSKIGSRSVDTIDFPSIL